jgi:dipeptidyl aminopeptidase/acylaminoacyl peptidase
MNNLDSVNPGDPCWSTNGKQIAFDCVTPEGGRDIYVIDSEGGLARQLTTDPAWDAYPRWSLDSEWIYFASGRTGSAEIWRVPAEGGEPSQVTTNGGIIPTVSLDGEHLYYAKFPENTIWSRPIADGEETLILDNVDWQLWCLGMRGIYVLNREAEPLPCIRLFEYQSLELTIVAELTEDARRDSLGGGRHVSVAPRDEWFLYQVAAEEADIKLVENFQ